MPLSDGITTIISSEISTGYVYSALGAGGITTINVFAIAAIGADIYIGGIFTVVAGVTVSNVCRYNTINNTFYAMGAGISNNATISQSNVKCFCVVDTDLYIGGEFNLAGGAAAGSICKYNTLTGAYSYLGSAAFQGIRGIVSAICAVDDVAPTAGKVLYIGGSFDHVGSWTSGNSFAPTNAYAKNFVCYHINSANFIWVNYNISIGNYGFSLSAEGEIKDIIYLNNYLYISGTSTWYNSQQTTPTIIWARITKQIITGTMCRCTHTQSVANTVTGAYALNLPYAKNNFVSPFVDNTISGVPSFVVNGTDIYIFGSYTIGEPCLRKYDTITNTYISYVSMVPIYRSVNSTIKMTAYNNAIYMGGNFTTFGGVAASGICKYSINTSDTVRGGTVTAISSGIPTNSVTGSDFCQYIYAFGSVIIYSGRFTTAGGLAISNMCKLSTSVSLAYKNTVLSTITNGAAFDNFEEIKVNTLPNGKKCIIVLGTGKKYML